MQPKKQIIGTQIRRVEVLVGSEILELREPGMRATNEAMEALFDEGLSVGLATLGQLLKEWEVRKQAELQVGEREGIASEVMSEVARRGWVDFLVGHAADIIGVLKGAVLPVLTKKAGVIAGIVLDTSANRKATGMESDALRAYVFEELSLDQAIDVLIALKDMIDWGAFAKKAKALLALGANKAPLPIEAPVTPTSVSMS